MSGSDDNDLLFELSPASLPASLFEAPTPTLPLLLPPLPTRRPATAVAETGSGVIAGLSTALPGPSTSNLRFRFLALPVGPTPPPPPPPPPALPFPEPRSPMTLFMETTGPRSTLPERDEERDVEGASDSKALRTEMRVSRAESRASGSSRRILSSSSDRRRSVRFVAELVSRSVTVDDKLARPHLSASL